MIKRTTKKSLTMINNINDYYLYNKTPNTIHFLARVYTKTFFFATNNNFKDRLVRVYLPSTYDFHNPNQRFKVIYMLDGKNLFDDYTSFVGEWGIDESIEEMIHENISKGYIVVGVDAPNTDIDRSLEMSPRGIKRTHKNELKGDGYAHKLVDFIFEVVKPDIDKTFFTDGKIGVAGSSMGGLMAFYLALSRPEEIEFSLAFSPAFFLFKWDNFKSYLDKTVKNNLPKIFFYVGGQGFERVFVETTLRTYNYLLDKGYTHQHIKIIYDSDKEHNEKAWREYFPIMLQRISE